MLQNFIISCLSFIAGALFGAGAYYSYVNHIWKHYPEQFRFLLNSRIGDRHACNYVVDVGERGDILCSRPAINQCVDCEEWYCDEHFNQFMKRCDYDSDLKVVKEI